MKHRDLMKTIAKNAKRDGLTVETREGGGHTVVKVGDLQTTVPRHREVNELTARGILRHLFPNG